MDFCHPLQGALLAMLCVEFVASLFDTNDRIHTCSDAPEYEMPPYLLHLRRLAVCFTALCTLWSRSSPVWLLLYAAYRLIDFAYSTYLLVPGRFPLPYLTVLSPAEREKRLSEEHQIAMVANEMVECGC